MSSLRINTLANFAGQLSGTLVGFLVVPFYIKFLGKEAYGLVGFFLSLQSILAILDLGLSVTANREISRLNAKKSEPQVLKDFLRTLEVFYWLMGIIVFAVLGLASGWLASNWIKTEKLALEDVKTCVLLSIATIGVRWPVSLYQGVLRGFEQQVNLNLLQSAIAVLKGVGSVALLWLVAPSVVLFHKWQFLMGLLEVVVMLFLAWKCLGGFSVVGAAWRLDCFQGVWRFAVKVAGASVFAMLLKQVDRMLISKMLPLEQLGYYTTAVIAGMGLTKIFMPVQAAVFPRLTKQYSSGETNGLSETFHNGCQAVAFLTSAPAAILVFFPSEFLALWTRSEDYATQAASPLAITALAMLFNSMMSIPFSLTVATGMTWLPLWTNGIGVVLLTPLTYFLVREYGISGGAWAWLIFNVGYYLVVPHILFRNVLSNEKWRWYTKDTGFFIAAALLLISIARYSLNGASSFEMKLMSISIACFAYTCVCVSFSSGVKSLIFKVSIIQKLQLRIKRQLN
jgi:O-antigen/teichoic acid export membrane protein